MDDGKPIRDARFNPTSFNEYLVHRPTPMLRSHLELGTGPYPVEDGEYPPVLSYELQRDGHNLPGEVLGSYASKAGVLIKAFSTAVDIQRAARKWYNDPKTNELEIEPPRKLSFHCYSDLYNARTGAGIIVGVENQSTGILVLDDVIDWYGSPQLCLTPSRIGVLEMAYFDISVVFTTAARGVRYRIQGTNWFAHLAVYTYALTRNYLYVELSKNRISFDDLYKKLSEYSSTSSPHDCVYAMNGTINNDRAARAVVQIYDQNMSNILTPIKYFLLNVWKSPSDDAK